VFARQWYTEVPTGTATRDRPSQLVYSIVATDRILGLLHRIRRQSPVRYRIDARHVTSLLDRWKLTDVPGVPRYPGLNRTRWTFD